MIAYCTIYQKQLSWQYVQLSVSFEKNPVPQFSGE
jgi:hypothetical protein